MRFVTHGVTPWYTNLSFQLRFEENVSLQKHIDRSLHYYLYEQNVTITRLCRQASNFKLLGEKRVALFMTSYIFPELVGIFLILLFVHLSQPKVCFQTVHVTLGKGEQSLD